MSKLVIKNLKEVLLLNKNKKNKDAFFNSKTLMTFLSY